MTRHCIDAMQLIPNTFKSAIVSVEPPNTNLLVRKTLRSILYKMTFLWKVAATQWPGNIISKQMFIPRDSQTITEMHKGISNCFHMKRNSSFPHWINVNSSLIKYLNIQNLIIELLTLIQCFLSDAIQHFIFLKLKRILFIV